MTRTFRIVNLGCKVNRVESDAFFDALGESGLVPAGPEDADVVVVNTCTVTAVAEKKARKAVRHALSANPRARVVVTGCASAINAGEFADMSDRVEVVPKAAMIDRLAAIGDAASGTAPDSRLAAASDAPETARERFGLKVQDGCSNECTYCIVRIARGPERSVPVRSVLNSARAMFSSGIPEVVLTGINLGRYSSDGTDLAGLLSLLLDQGVPGRIRLSSIEPDNVTADLVELVASADGRICRHLHLPLQSGSSKVLFEMNRRYSAEEFASTVRAIRARMPGVSLTTDVIVGFPGETEDDFAQSMELCRRCGFSKIHVFPYSEREGTPAAARSDQVPKEVRMLRAAELRRLAAELRAEDLALRAGTVELAAVESPSRATTESYHEIVPPAGARVGTLVEATL